ncbi:hypothetical protein GMDG_05421 [Pseudogymnoascus destructans 20631-21]|uniref:Uncharacterized protein n=2 Tax=Pseudogymnoascus destructans TaxID=655981 RepID=L8FN61_PSED2|nr:hypothetical protein GMDG_05421 [Pseudogymnoascus destructans 20631-21]
MAESRLQAAVIEATEQATASRPSETASVFNIPPAMPLQGAKSCVQGLPVHELYPIEVYNKQHSVEQTVAPGLEQSEFGEGSSGGEEGQNIEPQMASIIGEWPYKARKSAKNPIPAMIENGQARAIAGEDTARLKADQRTADEIYGTDGPVTEGSHPHTFSVQFLEHGLAMDADFMGVRSFQNCLECYVAGEAPVKQRSSHRPVDTLQRIGEKNPIPPPHYPRDDKKVCASWRHEINSKWVSHDERVYRLTKAKVRAYVPEMPTENWYTLLATIHHDHGHQGRDAVFEKVKSITPSISKGFVAAYVSCCCLQRKSSPRKDKNVREAFAGQELAKAGKPSKGKKRAIAEADPESPSPAARRPRAHSTEPAMVNAGDEQDPSLRIDYSPPQMGVEFPIAMADPYRDVAGPVENHREVIAHQAAPYIPEGPNNALAFDVAGIAAVAPVAPGSESTQNDSWSRPQDMYGSGAEEWQGDDSDWLTQTASDVSGLSSLGGSFHTDDAAREQASQATIDPRLLALPAPQGDNTSRLQPNDNDAGLSLGLEDPSVDTNGSLSDAEFGQLVEDMSEWDLTEYPLDPSA